MSSSRSGAYQFSTRKRTELTLIQNDSVTSVIIFFDILLLVFQAHMHIYASG
jgi:hypothetical protein